MIGYLYKRYWEVSCQCPGPEWQCPGISSAQDGTQRHLPYRRKQQHPQLHVHTPVYSVHTILVGVYLPSCVCVTSVRRFFKVWPGVRALSGTFWEGEQEMINPPPCLLNPPSDNCIIPVRSTGRGCCHQVWQQSQQSASSCGPDYHIHCNRRAREGLCRTWTPSLSPRLGGSMGTRPVYTQNQTSDAILEKAKITVSWASLTVQGIEMQVAYLQESAGKVMHM